MSFEWHRTTHPRWKYRVVDDYEHHCKYRMLRSRWQFTTMENPHFNITANFMTLLEGYTWNGSNVVVDTKTDMLASAVHDLQCQLMELGYYEPTLRNWRMAAAEYRRNCMDAGMPWWRAWARFTGILVGGGNEYKWRGVLKRG